MPQKAQYLLLCGASFALALFARSQLSLPKEQPLKSNFFEIPPDSIRRISLVAKNDSPIAVDTSEIKPSCGCTIAVAPKRFIPPGKELILDLAVSSSKSLGRKKIVIAHETGVLAEFYFSTIGEPPIQANTFSAEQGFFPGTIISVSLIARDGIEIQKDKLWIHPNPFISFANLEAIQLDDSTLNVSIEVQSLTGVLDGFFTLEIPLAGKDYSGLIEIPYSFPSGWVFSNNRDEYELVHHGSPNLLANTMPALSSWFTQGQSREAGTISWGHPPSGSRYTSPSLSLFHDGEQYTYIVPQMLPEVDAGGPLETVNFVLPQRSWFHVANLQILNSSRVFQKNKQE